jgi:heme o synthase
MAEEALYRQSFFGYISSICRLCKIRISLFCSLSAVSGLFLAPQPSGEAMSVLATGVFLTASGAGALNHYQERFVDALMARTSGRPIPSGRIDPGSALRLSMLLIILGLAVLFLGGNPVIPLLGGAAVLWYNGVYTRLKGYSGFAAIPGALVGAIPPAMGWVAGNGDILDPRPAALCFFFYMWQVLHFFIHIRDCGEEYEKAGLPSLSHIFTHDQLDRLVFQWLVALSVSTQLMIFFGVIRSPLVNAALLAASLWLAFTGFDFIREPGGVSKVIFRRMNFYMLSILFMMTIDGL